MDRLKSLNAREGILFIDRDRSARMENSPCNVGLNAREGILFIDAFALLERRAYVERS